MRQEILNGPERRRRWSDEEKIAILIEADDGAESVASVARRHDITRQHIYQWRSAMRKCELPGSQTGRFLELQVDGCDPVVASGGASCSGSGPVCHDQRVEIVLRNGRALRLPLSVAEECLKRLIRVVEAA